MSEEERLQKFLKRIIFWEEFIWFYRNNYPIDFVPWGISMLDVPTFHRQSMIKAANELSTLDFQYPDRSGTLNFKKVIVDTFQELGHFKNITAKDNVAIGLGANSLTHQIMMNNLKSDDDEILFIEPIYPYHFIPLLEKEKVKIKIIASHFNHQTELFDIDFDMLRSKLNKNSKLLVLCNPNNPTGRILSTLECKKISQILDDFPNLRVIEDCAYAIFTNNGTKMNYFHELGKNIEKTYAVFSGGKIFNTTGNRVGFVISSKLLIDEFKQLSYLMNNCSPVDQYTYQLSMIESMKEYQGKTTFWEYQACDHTKRLNYFVDGLNKFGIKSYPSQGTYYLTIDSVKLSEFTEEKYFFVVGTNPAVKDASRDKAVCRKLIVESKIGLIPFSSIIFTNDNTDQFIRVSFNRSYEDLDLCLNGLRKFFK